MAVLTKDVGRMDVLLHRGSDERVGIYWKIDKRDGGPYEVIDMRRWSCTYEMYWNGEKVYTLTCRTTSNGTAWAEIPGAAFTGAEWDERVDGQWRIMGEGPAGERDILGHGYYRIVI